MGGKATDSDHAAFRGVVLLAMLRLLSKGQAYGYELVTALAAFGLDGVGEGTIYPALNRLEREGVVVSHLVRSDKGPARKYYELTVDGRGMLAAREAIWSRLVEALPPADMEVHA